MNLKKLVLGMDDLSVAGVDFRVRAKLFDGLQAAKAGDESVFAVGIIVVCADDWMQQTLVRD